MGARRMSTPARREQFLRSLGNRRKICDQRAAKIAALNVRMIRQILPRGDPFGQLLLKLRAIH